ncbi:MAG: hypothetical protein E7643_07325 [Ruminococcaceae bacterium]|nr:hypothetical protein [Oscillospiraceae bacterium]
MNPCTDWNCKLHTHEHHTALSDSLLLMHERFAIKRFCFMTEYDPSTSSLASFRIQRERFLSSLRESLPASFKINYTAAVRLTPHLSEVAELNRLTATADSLLPIVLPLESYTDWMDKELNHLLYKRHMKPLFLSFELYPILYPLDVTERLLRIPDAAYQFNYKAFANPSSARMISTLLQRGATVLLGTASNSVEKLLHYEYDYYLELAKEVLSPSEYSFLMKRNKALWK